MTRVDPYTIPLPETTTDLRWIRLRPEQVEEGLEFGELRFEHAVEAGLVSAFAGDASNPEASRRAHRMGAVGELAFCWYYGIPWPKTIDTFSRKAEPDVPPDIEVRTTSGWAFLKVRPSDHPTRRVTFVVHENKSEWWYVSGLWIRAADAQQRYPKTDPGNRGAQAHFVPREDLTPRISIPEHGVHAWQLDGADGAARYYCTVGGERL